MGYGREAMGRKTVQGSGFANCNEPLTMSCIKGGDGWISDRVGVSGVNYARKCGVNTMRITGGLKK